VPYNYDFVRTKLRAKKILMAPQASRDLLPGVAARADEIVVLEKVWSKGIGWSQLDQRVIQVAREAKSYRTPEPRFSSSTYPLRSTFGRYQLSSGEVCWQRLESKVPFWDLRNQHSSLAEAAPVLISVFDVARR
jgi:hypothetical protein